MIPHRAQASVPPLALPLLSALLCLAPADHLRAAADTERMLQSAVRILCWSKDSLFVGSGFVIGLDGTATYVVTNQHVIDCAKPDERKLSIILPDRKVDAESVWANAAKDLAVLRTRAPLGRPV